MFNIYSLLVVFAVFIMPFMLGLSVCMYIRDQILKICEHDILQIACENFTKFTTELQLGTKMN